MLSISLKDPTVRSVVHITYNIMGASVQILTSKCTALHIRARLNRTDRIFHPGNLAAAQRSSPGKAAIVTLPD